MAFACVLLLIFIINFFNLLTTSVNGEILPFQQIQGDVAINCGSFSNSTALDGRHWVSDGETPHLRREGYSRTAISDVKLVMSSVDPTPFLTSRISSTYFSYTFQVNPGQKFVRLHFYPAPYQGGFRNSRDFFTVKANSFTLLQNFSASLYADALGVRCFVKEYCLSVNETGILQITFSALLSDDAFVFVNGIEIISMPTDLYYTSIDNLGAYIVGHPKHFYYVDNSTALELIQRLNIGGGSISPVEDNTGMFRKWSEDDNYVLASSDFQQIRNPMPIITSSFLAPFKIYQTSRVLKKGLRLKGMHPFTWTIPVDLGFCYLLRLHFCSDGGEISEVSHLEEFGIVIQSVVVVENVIELSGGNGIAVYRDYLVMMKGDKTEEEKRDLLVSLQSSDDDMVLGLLKGLEIFKLSNADNNLASPNSFSPIQNSSFWSVKNRFFMVVSVLTMLLAIVNVVVYHLRQISEHEFRQDKKHVRLVPNEPSCYRFSINEILSATRNFDEALVIGKGGFGKVYKGSVYGHQEVLAIKRLKLESSQGANEFWREIETLSKLRHIHLVPLIGYCNESEEMILVYEYMSGGTIADNIYKTNTNVNDGIPLTWEQRLKICIGAARGLDYLHTGTQYGIIHRDVKDTNILLDENYMAKISDFGLSKVIQGSTRIETQRLLSTKVMGTFGYLDPHYLETRMPSVTSDVYAFGVVLLVVLSGRPALEIKLSGEVSSLLTWFRECKEKNELNQVIDPIIHGDISNQSLITFIEAVENCLHHVPIKRATMAQLVVKLELALEKNRAELPSEIECKQPFAPIIEENAAAASFQVEGNSNTNMEIRRVELPNKAKVLKSRKTDENIIRKPAVRSKRHWFPFKNTMAQVVSDLDGALHLAQAGISK